MEDITLEISRSTGPSHGTACVYRGEQDDDHVYRTDEVVET